MKTSTVTLSVLLVGSIAYAAFLQIELNRLTQIEEEAVVPKTVEEKVTPDREDGLQIETSARSSSDERAESTGEEEPAEGRGNRESRRRERLQQMLSTFDNPQMRMDMIERQMNRVDDRYASFFKRLDLSPVELETLRTMIAETGVLGWEMRMRGFNAASDEDRQRIEDERELQRSVLKSEINSLLGEENATALQEYNDSLPYRGEVESLASSLSYTDTPLTERQTEVLVSSLKDVHQNFEYTKDLSNIRGRDLSEISSSDLETYFSEREARDAEVLEIASDSLNDEQLAAYAERQLAERERDQRQFQYMVENPGVGGPGFGGRRGGGPRP